LLNFRNEKSRYESTLKLLTTKVDKAEKNSIQKEKECERVIKELQMERIEHQYTKSKYEKASRTVIEKDDEMTKLQLFVEQSKTVEFEQLSEMLSGFQMRREESSLNEALIAELKKMRENFEGKLAMAAEEVNRIQTNYEKQLFELYETVKMERGVMDRKVRKFQERCEYLEKRVQMLESERK
jgi:hypothetical protein